ncbi:MAG: hypothetical protein ABSB79_11660 [Syntrophales bacterium]
MVAMLSPLFFPQEYMKRDFVRQYNFDHKMSGVNYVDYGLKSCIFVEVDDLKITGSNGLAKRLHPYNCQAERLTPIGNLFMHDS